MPVFDRSVSHQMLIIQLAVGETILALDAYGSIEKANIYFDNRLNSSIWLDSELDDKKLALVSATRLIDNLNFRGDKTSSIQLHEWPRGIAGLTPRDIELACYEIAYKLLEGYNPDYEVENVSAESRGYGGARTTYNRSFVLDHIASGIPSFRAWALLKPYLRDPGNIKLSRVT